MAFWNRKTPAGGTTLSEKRNSLENETIPVSSAGILDFFGVSNESAAGVHVTIAAALGVPAVWAAVNFLSGTMASLPLNHYRKTDSGREKVDESLSSILKHAVNDECTSFDWRKYSFDQTFTAGRQVSFIERSAAGKIINIWPLNPEHVTIKRRGGRKFYDYQDGTRTVRYNANEVIDIPFMLESDQLTARSPIFTNKDVIGLAIAATTYGSRFFQGGGIPPAVLEGPFQSESALKRAMTEMISAIKNAYKERRSIVAVPQGHQIKAIGVEPDKSQLVELKASLVVEVARIYSLPPAFLQDLTNGTFSNTEQQDLQLVKHVITRWAKQTEQELNLKLFGRGNTTEYVEFNLDGLQRGDFATRMEGYAKAIQNAIYTPAQVHEKENLPSRDDADVLLIQGATVPLGTQPTIQPPNQPTA